MPLLVISHPDCAGHDPVPGHPERPARLEAALGAFDRLDGVESIEARPVTREQLARVHGPAYLDQLEGLRQSGAVIPLDPDTYLGPGSLRAAELAAGATCMAAEAAVGHPETRAFAIVRPPGHHAESARAMGFCIYNSIAVAAAHALTLAGIERVAICDFDVHHGNGTEEIFAGHRQVAYASSHQSPLYPGTGDPTTSLADNIFNVQLPPGSGGEAFRRPWEDDLLPKLEAFGPDLVLVSAGFDGHWSDPLAGLELSEADFHWIGKHLAGLADRHASGRLAATLEGGYNLTALADSVLAFSEGIAG